MGGAYLSDVGDAYTTAESIELVRLDDWVAANRVSRVDLVKLDIEGAEPWALQGATRSISRFDPILLIEFNPLSLMARGYDSDSLYRDLRRQFSSIAYIKEDGKTYWVSSLLHLNRLVQRKGFVDLVCHRRFPRNKQAVVRSLHSLGELLILFIRYNRFRPSPLAFLIQPSYEVRFVTGRLDLQVEQRGAVTVSLKNTGPVWWNSDYHHHPIHAAYHWADATGSIIERDGLRTKFPRPVGPGRSTELEIEVLAPRKPGEYSLIFSLVQERVMWCDEVVPRLARSLPVTVVS